MLVPKPSLLAQLYHQALWEGDDKVGLTMLEQADRNILFTHLVILELIKYPILPKLRGVFAPKSFFS